MLKFSYTEVCRNHDYRLCSLDAFNWDSLSPSFLLGVGDALKMAMNITKAKICRRELFFKSYRAHSFLLSLIVKFKSDF